MVYKCSSCGATSDEMKDKCDCGGEMKEQSAEGGSEEQAS